MSFSRPFRPRVTQRKAILAGSAAEDDKFVDRGRHLAVGVDREVLNQAIGLVRDLRVQGVQHADEFGSEIYGSGRDIVLRDMSTFARHILRTARQSDSGAADSKQGRHVQATSGIVAHCRPREGFTGKRVLLPTAIVDPDGFEGLPRILMVS